jgi:type I restriction enzyme S subunit
MPSIGDVPEHWRVFRIRNVCKLLVSNVDKNSNDDEIPVRLCNYVDVYKNDRITGRIAFMRATATQDEIDRFRPRVGDVIITKDSEDWRDIGVPALVAYEAPDLVCGYHLALMRPRSDLVRGAYLFRVLQSQPVAYQFQVSANGVTRYGLSHGAIKGVSIPLPPMDEQDAIVRVLNHVDRLIEKYAGVGAFIGKQANAVFKRGLAGRGVALLGEYRTRLIADVVTGKLDVRVIAATLPDVADSEPIEEPEGIADFDEPQDAVDEEAAA